MKLPDDIVEYNRALVADDRVLCERLAQVFSGALLGATAKVWHAHPVWFDNGNPLVGYARRKNGICVLFWSGQSFAEPGLTHTGSFRAAEYWPSGASEIDDEKLTRWLADALRVQWNYRDIRTNRGLVKLTGFLGFTANGINPSCSRQRTS